jgi:hypothetical protein
MAALGCVLGNINSDIRKSVFKIVTAAIDQGVLYCCQEM